MAKPLKVKLRKQRTSTSTQPLKSRIVGHDDVDPSSLIPNPENWRKHPDRQRSALRASLEDIGWVSSIMVNRNTGRMIDGHARMEEALSRGETSVPVDYVDLTEDEERAVLATLDPIGAMADADASALSDLVSDSTFPDLMDDVFDASDGGREELNVDEIDVSSVVDEFWISVRGPLPSQPEVLRVLKENLQAIDGVNVVIGGYDGD
jgi:hypothetical protein